MQQRLVHFQTREKEKCRPSPLPMPIPACCVNKGAGENRGVFPFSHPLCSIYTSVSLQTALSTVLPRATIQLSAMQLRLRFSLALSIFSPPPFSSPPKKSTTAQARQVDSTGDGEKGVPIKSVSSSRLACPQRRFPFSFFAGPCVQRGGDPTTDRPSGLRTPFTSHSPFFGAAAARDFGRCSLRQKGSPLSPPF